MNSIKTFGILAAFVVSFFAYASDDKPTNYVGVLEDKNFAFYDKDSEEGHAPNEAEKLFITEKDEAPKPVKVTLKSVERLVRPMFKFDESTKKWVDIGDKKTPSTEWTISMGGKTFGTVKSTSVSELVDSDYAPQKLLHTADTKANSSIPKMKSKIFSGWGGAASKRENYRPLVVSAPDFTKDPDGWKPGKAPKRLLEEAKKYFVEQAKLENRCSTNLDKDEGPKNLNLKEEWVQNKDTYVSNHHSMITTLYIVNPKCQWGDSPTPSYEGKVIYVAQDLKPMYLGHGLTLVDFGDYDGNGEGEVLFFAPAYNEDGYVLFSRLFKDKITHSWNYH